MKIAGILLLVSALAFSGCASMMGNILSTHDEVLVGVALMQEVESRELLSGDAALQDYVDDVGRKLVRVAKRQHIPYTFKVLEDDAVNAFALPAGYFYVTTGFLKACSNEAELAGMMAHELAHVVAQHHGDVLSREYGNRILQGQVLGSDAIATRQMTLDLLNQFTEIHFSDRQEGEADEISTELLIRAGYDARALPDLLYKLYQLESPGDTRPDIFSGSLQPTPERLDRLYGLYFEYPEAERAGLGIFEEAYREGALSRLE